MRADGPRETPRVTDFAAGGGKGDGFRPESVPLVGPHGSGHACTSPSGGSAALCAPACHGRGRGRRFSPRMGVRVTDSGPKASPLQGPAAAEGGICHERGRGRRSCHRTHRGRNRTPRETARGDAAPRFPDGIFSLAGFQGSGTPARRPRAVPRHFARRQTVESTKGDGFRRGKGQGRRIRGRKRRPCGVPRQRRAGRARRARD